MTESHMITTGRRWEAWGGFKEVCKLCQHSRDCISAHYMARWMPRLYVLQKVLRKKPMEAQKWINGLEKHREMEVKIGLKEFSPGQLFRMLKADKAQVTFTGDICSPTYGLCGSPDCVEITRKDSRLHMRVVEWKADWKGSYWLQLWTYATIFSDENMLLGDKPFYTEVSEEPLEMNITCTLVPYYDYEYADEKDFMLKNRITGPGKWAIIKRRREYTKLNSCLDYNFVPECTGCKHKPEHCGYWDVCRKVLPTRKKRQLTLGRFGVRRISIPKRYAVSR